MGGKKRERKKERQRKIVFPVEVKKKKKNHRMLQVLCVNTQLLAEAILTGVDKTLTL